MPRPWFLALLASGLLAACHAQDERASVVLILVDQLRKDSADQWLSETHALAEKGVSFESMRSVAPWTYPSVTSLLSGLYPQQHGADRDASGTQLTLISDAVPLLPRTLRANGYHTAGFVTNPFFHESNVPVRQSFDYYDASFIGDQGMTRGHGEIVWTKRMYSDSVNPAIRTYFDGRALTRPEFTYVHYIDVHGRKEGPERWKDAPFEPSYEAATRHVDAKIKELYDYFTARYHGNVIFLVTSDHGQDLDDDLQIGDGVGRRLRERKASLHDFNLRIPLYILPSRSVSAARVISEPCANIDVVPTLLEWLGLPLDASAPGRSLLGAIRGQPYDGKERVLYARNSAQGRLEEAIVHEQKKFMRYQKPVRARRLFDLDRDPREIHALDQDSSAEERLLDESADPHGVQFPAHYQELDPGAQKALNGLGYGESETPPSDAPPSAPPQGSAPKGNAAVGQAPEK